MVLAATRKHNASNPEGFEPLAAGNSKGASPYGDIVNLVFVGATPCGRPLTMIWDN